MSAKLDRIKARMVRTDNEIRSLEAEISAEDDPIERRQLRRDLSALRDRYEALEDQVEEMEAAAAVTGEPDQDDDDDQEEPAPKKRAKRKRKKGTLAEQADEAAASSTEKPADAPPWSYSMFGD